MKVAEAIHRHLQSKKPKSFLWWVQATQIPTTQVYMKRTDDWSWENESYIMAINYYPVGLEFIWSDGKTSLKTFALEYEDPQFIEKLEAKFDELVQEFENNVRNS